jgi:CBS domain-containing protein
VSPETPLADLVELMERRRIKRVPVVRGRRVIGIVSRANLLRALVAQAGAAPAAEDDSRIRARLLAELDKQLWAPRACIEVVVRDGAVDLFGAITDERERGALRVLAENVPGVRTVRDHLTWVEPMSGTVIEAPADGEPQSLDRTPL